MCSWLNIWTLMLLQVQLSVIILILSHDYKHTTSVKSKFQHLICSFIQTLKDTSSVVSLKTWVPCPCSSSAPSEWERCCAATNCSEVRLWPCHCMIWIHWHTMWDLSYLNLKHFLIPSIYASSLNGPGPGPHLHLVLTYDLYLYIWESQESQCCSVGLTSLFKC